MIGLEIWHLDIKIFEPCLVLDFDVESLIWKSCDNWTEGGLNSKSEEGCVKGHAGWKGLTICLSDGKVVMCEEQ
jgi:hypothetical protein